MVTVYSFYPSFQNEEPDVPPLQVIQFHYLAWPDHGVPKNAISMINFIKRVRRAHAYDRQDLLLVHCSAGVGRTGTFITLDSMMKRMKMENSINILEFVSNLRKQRVLMVQTLVKLTIKPQSHVGEMATRVFAESGQGQQ
jgi:netrin-G3 ligand